MESRKRKASISIRHKSLKRKLTNATCPGCHNSFSKQSFFVHKEAYFDNYKETWKCKHEHNSYRANDATGHGGQNDPDPDEYGRATGDETNNEQSQCTHNENDACDVSNGFDTPVRFKEDFQNAVRKHLKKVLTHVELEETGDELENSSDETEIWSNVTIDEVISDTDHNNQEATATREMPHSSTLALWLCLFICTLQVAFMLPDSVVTEILHFLGCFFGAVSDTSPIVASISVLFPTSIYMLWKTLGLDKDQFRKYVVCKKCFNIYKYEDCIQTSEGKQISRECSFVAYPNHTQAARRSKCGQTLLKRVKVGKKEILYPHKTYCYMSITDTVKRMVKGKQFENQCNRWRDGMSADSGLADVYDGRVWKEFMSDTQQKYLGGRHNYALMLNLDWFQPFKHVKYSVGVIYAVILNLPRSERFKVENVLLIGIIPDMKKEPPVSTFLEPLVNELKTAWDTGVMCTTYEHPSDPIKIRLALLCIGCDIPATRKLCGFLGHAATLGCSKCFKNFPGTVGEKDYSGFDRQSWPKRSMPGHVKLINKLQSAKTQTEQQRLESRFGVRYSCLTQLSYINVVRFSTIDPMHNLYQGTAKHMLKLWIKSGAIDEKDFCKIQEKTDNVHPASSIGKLPRKIACSFAGFTAEQWMNWTNIFSVFALHGILEDKYLQNWRYFVQASRLLCSKFVTESTIACIDDCFLRFCRGVEELYGKGAITPNMHLHGHVAECLKDYGPAHTFWLFSFERYNGHLGDMPNNCRDIETQFMRRFQRDAFVMSIPLPNQFRDNFSRCLNILRPQYVEAVRNINSYQHLRTFAEPCTAIGEKQWSDIDIFKYHNVTISKLHPEELNALAKTYQVLYPSLDIADYTISVSCHRLGYVSCGHEVIGSVQSRHNRSSVIMANWSAGDGNIVSDADLDVVPGIVQTFVLHNLMTSTTNKLHLFAQVQWCTPKRTARFSYGYPVEIWSDKLFETFGASSFIPVQRIRCKAVAAYGKLRNKSVLFVIPTRQCLEF